MSRKNILIVSPVVTDPSYSGNSTRISQMVDMLVVMGVHVSFLLVKIPEIDDRKVNDATSVRFSGNYYEANSGRVCRGRFLLRLFRFLKRLMPKDRFLSIHDQYFPSLMYTRDIYKDISATISSIQPDAVIFEYVLLAPLASICPSEVLTIIDTHDRFSDRNKMIRLSGGEGAWWSLSPRQEKDCLNQFDQVIAIQEDEHRFFTEKLGIDPEKVNTVDIISLPEVFKSDWSSTPVIGFVGSNNHHNREGLRAFIQNHLEFFKRKFPDFKLLIAGSIVLEIEDPSIIYLGKVDNLFLDFYEKCSIIINPTLSGSGLKIKTVEAMGYGLPVVSTKEGLSGMVDAIGSGVYLADLHSSEFFECCKLLLESKALAIESGSLARQYVVSRYKRSQDVLTKILS